MSPSRNGSCGGSSPSRNRCALAASSYPRRTRTLAVRSEIPSAAASSLACRCGHGRRVQMPSCMGQMTVRGASDGALQRRVRPNRARFLVRCSWELCGVRVRVLEDVECVVGPRCDVQHFAGCRVVHGDREPVRPLAPEERDLEAVGRAVVELLREEIGLGCVHHRGLLLVRWRSCRFAAQGLRRHAADQRLAVRLALLLVRKLHAEHGQQREQREAREPQPGDEARVLRLEQLLPRDLAPEDEQADPGRDADDDHRCEVHRFLERPAHDQRGQRHEHANRNHPKGDPQPHREPTVPRAILRSVEPNYMSGEDYAVEFLGYRFSFGALDFEERVTAAAVKLGLLEGNELDDDETADLVELVERGSIDEARSGLGRYLVRHWERVSLVDGESLVYWLRKLVFRGAWLDHRVKEGLLEVTWDEDQSDFGYRDPRGGRALLELAPVPSWHELQFRR